MIAKQKLVLLITGGLLLIPLLACGSVGLYDPQATQVAMQATVTSLQATISALEATQSEPRTQPSPRVIVVTATPTPIVGSGAVQSAGETAAPATDTPSPTATPLPTSTSAGVTQGQAIVVVATLTPTPTPKLYDFAPITTEPRAGTVVEEGREILLRWSWNGLLGPGEHYDLKIRPDGQTRSAYVAWEQGEAHDLKADLPPGRYFWTVQVIKGHYQNNSGEPEDRVFEAFLSPESEPRLIIVAKKEKEKTKTPTPTDTARPTVQPDNTPEPTSEATSDSSAADPADAATDDTSTGEDISTGEAGQPADYPKTK